MANTPAHAAHFDRPVSGRREGAAFPQLRTVALAECGTHAMFAAAMGSCTTGEPAFAKALVGALRPAMLRLADRGFTAYPVWSAAAESGADLVWQAKGNAVLPVLERHPDGSHASELVAADDPRLEHPLPVRVVEYALDDPDRPQSEAARYRLVTTLRDPGVAAAELAALYSERWDFESALDELKTHLGGPRVVVRSRTVEGVYQEAWGFCCVHCALRPLLSAAADDGDLDPDRLSFTRALRAARRSVPAGVCAGRRPALALRRAIAETLAGLLPPRRCGPRPAWSSARCRTFGSSARSTAPGPNRPSGRSRPLGSALLPKLSVSGLG